MPRKILLITNYMIEIQNIIIDRRIDVSQESLASKQASKQASLGDLKLFLVHYDNFEQFSRAWNRRSKRINKDNMFFLMNDRNYCSEKEIVAFDQLGVILYY